MEDRDTTAISSCIRGYHAYKDIWNPSVRDMLECCRELTNVQNRYAVAVVYNCRKDMDDDLDDDTTVGHLPRKISCVCSLFVQHGGSITCEISGRSRNFSDLPQGGLEIPCLLILEGSKTDIFKDQEQTPSITLFSTTGYSFV